MEGITTILSTKLLNSSMNSHILASTNVSPDTVINPTGSSFKKFRVKSSNMMYRICDTFLRSIKDRDEGQMNTICAIVIIGFLLSLYFDLTKEKGIYGIMSSINRQKRLAIIVTIALVLVVSQKFLVVFLPNMILALIAIRIGL